MQMRSSTRRLFALRYFTKYKVRYFTKWLKILVLLTFFELTFCKQEFNLRNIGNFGVQNAIYYNVKLSFCSFPNCLLMCSVKVQTAKKFLPRGRISDMRKELWLSSLSVFYFWRISSQYKYRKQEFFHFVFHCPIMLYSSNEALLYYTRHRTQKLIAPRFKFRWNCIHTMTTIN